VITVLSSHRLLDKQDLVIVENLERVIQDCLNDTNLPASIGNIAAGACAYQGGTI
jgi:hypothetical protein